MTALATPPEAKRFGFYNVGKSVSTRDLDKALALTGMNFTVTRHDLMVLGRNHEIDENGKPDHLRFEQTGVTRIADNEITLSQVSPYNGLVLPDQVAIVRDDIKQVLCTMGSGYTPLQNRDCVSIIEDVIANDDEIVIVQGGIIKNCERLFLAIELPGSIRLGPTEIRRSIIVNWSHTGKSALSIRFVPYMVSETSGVCLAANPDVAIRHTSGGPRRVEEARKILGRARNYYADLEAQLGGLGNTPMTGEELGDFLLTLFPDPNRGDDNAGNPDDITNIQEVVRNPRKSRNAAKREKIEEMFEQDDDWNGTQLGAYLALCNFVDVENTVKKSTKGYSEEDCRLDSVWFGAGSKTKQKGFSTILKW